MSQQEIKETKSSGVAKLFTLSSPVTNLTWSARKGGAETADIKYEVLMATNNVIDLRVPGYAATSNAGVDQNNSQVNTYAKYNISNFVTTMNENYQILRAANSGRVNYYPIHYTKYFLYARSYMATLIDAIKFYTSVINYNYINVQTPFESFLAAGGTSKEVFDDIISNRANIIDALNHEIGVFNTTFRMLPVKILLLDAYLLGNLFKDSDDDKFTVKGFSLGECDVLDSYTYINESNETVTDDAAIRSLRMANSARSTWDGMLKEIKQAKSIYESLSEAAFTILKGDIEKITGPVNLYAVPFITDTSHPVPIYDADIKNMLRNMTTTIIDDVPSAVDHIRTSCSSFGNDPYVLRLASYSSESYGSTAFSIDNDVLITMNKATDDVCMATAFASAGYKNNYRRWPGVINPIMINAGNYYYISNNSYFNQDTGLINSLAVFTYQPTALVTPSFMSIVAQDEASSLIYTNVTGAGTNTTRILVDTDAVARMDMNQNIAISESRDINLFISTMTKSTKPDKSGSRKDTNKDKDKDKR